ncbi:hypothetical protein ATANTOWER_008460 [Ataeniobius toweri]|uniref:Uncharacterized protein n=1 Tax=Ataeniobius toweri TaxID=208326 RepID=A0ABU7BP33_9TELE|nr:hypothetical protein [Ataeniobius toweri]
MILKFMNCSSTLFCYTYIKIKRDLIDPCALCEQSRVNRVKRAGLRTTLQRAGVEDQWGSCEFPYPHHLGPVGEEVADPGAK